MWTNLELVADAAPVRCVCGQKYLRRDVVLSETEEERCITEDFFPVYSDGYPETDGDLGDPVDACVSCGASVYEWVREPW